MDVPRHATGAALKPKKRKASLGRHGKRGGYAKPKAKDKLHVADRDTTAAVETAQAAAIGAAEEGADARGIDYSSGQFLRARKEPSRGDS